MNKTLFLLFVVGLMPAKAQEYSNPYLAHVYEKCYKQVRDEMGFRSVKATKRAASRRRGSGQVIAVHSACVRSYY
jgi:hypothetical protein